MLRRRLIKSDSGDGRFMIGNYEVVDLGLPSGLLWATCNVRATKEEDYGYYYQWDDYTATFEMGSKWRMPTLTEINELINNTDYEWVTINGINGGKFISKINPNAYVFFPAAGGYLDDDLQDEGTNCCIWSSTLYEDGYAYYMHLNRDMRIAFDNDCTYEFSVRGVYG